MTQVFRAPAKQWLLRVVLPMVAVVALSVVAIVLWPETTWQVAFMVAVFGLAFLADAFPIWRAHIYMDQQSIWVNVKKKPFGLEWTKIVAAQVIEDLNHQKFLLLATMHTSLEFPLRYLDVEAVKQAALSYLGPEAFDPDAFDKVPPSLTLTYMWNQLLDEATMAVTVRMAGWIKTLGWVTIIAVAVVVSISSPSDSAIVALLFSPFIGMGLVLVNVGSTRLELSADHVRLRTILARYEMRWDEVRWIETDDRMSMLVLHGEDKRLTIPGGDYWSGADRGRAWPRFVAQMNARSVTMQRSFWSQFKLSKNTKVRR